MTVQIKGVAYETVHARLEAAHDTNARPKGIKLITTQPLEVAGRLIVCATVMFEDGRSFDGMSEAKLDATSGADRDAPVECAETSAIGRALAQAGYFGSGGLASQDEIRSAQSRAAGRAPRPAAPVPQGNAAPRPISPPAGPRLAQGLDVQPPARNGQDDAFAGLPVAPAASAGSVAPGLATDKQRELLRKFSFTEEAGNPNLTKVDASTLIERAIEAQRARR